MTTMRKITVEVPADTLAAATADGAGVAETVREALEQLVRNRAYDRLLAAAGTLKLDIDLKALREDKERVWPPSTQAP